MNQCILIIILESTLILILSAGLWISRRKNTALKTALEEENKKRLIPVLIFSLEGKEPSLHLRNEGSCSAKDIRVEDTTLDLDYEFKRTITVRFEPIPLLNPQQSVPLAIKACDRGHEVAAKDKEYLLAKLTQGTFEARLDFANMENVKYESVVAKHEGRFYIRETRVVPEQ